MDLASGFPGWSSRITERTLNVGPQNLTPCFGPPVDCPRVRATVKPSTAQQPENLSEPLEKNSDQNSPMYLYVVQPKLDSSAEFPNRHPEYTFCMKLPT